MEKKRKAQTRMFISADFYRFFSPGLWIIAILGVAAVFVISVSDILSPALHSLEASERPSIIDNFQMNLTFDRYSSLLVIASALTCVPGFAADRKSQFLRYLVQRGSLESYAWARVIVNAFFVIAVVVAGLLIAALSLLPWMTVPAKSNYHTYFFQGLVNGRFAWIYLILLGLNFAFAIIPVCNIGMMVSVFQPNPFVAIGSTFFSYYLLFSLTNHLPVELSYQRLAAQPLGGLGSVWQILLSFVISILTGKGFYLALQRRYNEGTL